MQALLLYALATGLATAGTAVPEELDSTPAYVARGHQTETRQRALTGRLDRFFEALSDRLRAALADRARALERDVLAGTSRSDPPGYLRIERTGAGEQVATLPIFTDIEDAAFLDAFRDAVESRWRARVGGDEVRTRVEIVRIPPHELYCQGAAAAGAATLHVTAGRAIVLGPHDVTPRVLAHEAGHLLGFPDAYLRGYRHFERLLAAREARPVGATG